MPDEKIHLPELSRTIAEGSLLLERPLCHGEVTQVIDWHKDKIEEMRDLADKGEAQKRSDIEQRVDELIAVSNYAFLADEVSGGMRNDYHRGHYNSCNTTNKASNSDGNCECSSNADKAREAAWEEKMDKEPKTLWWGESSEEEWPENWVGEANWARFKADSGGQATEDPTRQTDRQSPGH
ncbi:hypothetical protein I302_104797 [Kwoniella bestiolae CBS 10118]|uniref:Uncharacterized protein n=1 Tax=Kwoniella bestiolae CBS 10118 TaxID=1296100 RepID=A0A1B9FRR2_9TREE|nr:hypothetical protein I302_09134 [Kwoniella bestiolae CBS 10118]OCF21455.1 hypothetical protein I302_09134 [Kwoniella bestiolae CBS 10118]